MATEVPEEQHHEESETFQNPAGRWQNYYGGGPGMGLRIPLEPTASYATSGEAGRAAQARSDMYPSVLHAAAPKPGIPDYLAGTTAPGIPAAQIAGGGSALDMALRMFPPPSEADMTAARNRVADAEQDYLRKDVDSTALYKAKRDEADKAAQQYADLSQKILPTTPQLQAAPSRGLRPFLASTVNEDPYTSVSKFMQSVSLLATMMGGGRNGARASISAMTGALEGWNKGDRYQADAAYQTWRDTTGDMLKQFDDEMRRYNSIMIAERVPMEAKLRALETAAWERKNTMASAAAAMGRADKWFEHVDQAKKAAAQVALQASQIDAMKNNADKKYDLLQQQIQLQNDKLAQQIAALASGEKLRWEIEKLRSDTKLQQMQNKIDAAGQKLRPLSAQDEKIIDQAMDVDGMFAKMDELLRGGKVDLNKIVGGINPWLNSLSQKWGGRGQMPREGTQADPIDQKKMGRLTPEEQEFLSLMHNYGSTLLNQRSGSAVSGAEFDRYLQFGLDSSLSPATNRTRMLSLWQLNTQTLRNRLDRMAASRKDAPDINQLIPRLGAPVTSGAPASASPASNEPGKGWGRAELVK